MHFYLDCEKLNGEATVQSHAALQPLVEFTTSNKEKPKKKHPRLGIPARKPETLKFSEFSE